jgi:hypothetical protein
MALIRTNVSEERIASIIGVTRIRELDALAVTSNQSICSQHASVVVTANVIPSLPILFSLMMEAMLSS